MAEVLWGERIAGQRILTTEPQDMGDGTFAVAIVSGLPDWVRIPQEFPYPEWRGREVQLSKARFKPCPFTGMEQAIWMEFHNCPYICIESDKFYWVEKQ